jgi:predicted dithiol-disulfide oxidoreductase (DUF899 family)
MLSRHHEEIIMKPPSTASRKDWFAARLALLEEEKALTRARDAVTRKRQALPWVPVDEHYQFEGEGGTVSLAELFGEQDQLIVQHFMYAPDWQEGCPSCSFWADGFQGALAAFVAVSDAPLAGLLAYRERMGWRHRWVSAADSDFSHDYQVSYTPEQIAAGETFYNFTAGHHYGEHMPGISIFARDDEGRVYHTYSVYARGLDPLNVTYQLLDLLPLGRNEADLPYPMAWVKRADQYQV